MTHELTIARNYLIPPPHAFWVWSDQGDVVTWSDGSTIAFRGELAEILSGLAPAGLPPLGAVLLLIAATRDAWGAESKEAGLLATSMKSGREGLKNLGQIYNVVHGLEKVRQFDRGLRTAPLAKSALAQMVFEDWKARTSPQDAAVIVGIVSLGLGDVLSIPSSGWNWASDASQLLAVDLQCLQHGLQKLDADSLKLRLRTGLEELPQPAEVEIPLAERVRTLLADLKNDTELSGLARLALNLMAAVSIPRPVVDREELQVGGVSDITNRGPLDRLLLSELAHDDLSLAVRIAVNEALYLRRESPPRSPPRQRNVLLDVGLRTWGVPRVFATAIAMAVAATSERDTSVKTYRAAGERVEPVDLATRAGIVEHLAALDIATHPGRALEAFQVESGKAEFAAEPMLVTAADVVDDPDFQQMVVNHVDLPLHLSVVDRDGSFRLLEKSVRGSKLVKEAVLDLSGLFNDTSRSLIDPDVARDLPAIFSVKPFPLLLPHNLDPQRVWAIDRRGILMLTSDGRLMLWTDPARGARQVQDGLPHGGLWWSTWKPLEGVARAVIGTSPIAGLHLVEVDPDACRSSVQPLQVSRNLRCTCAHRGALFMVADQRVQVMGETTGDLLQTLDLPSNMAWQRDRFFYHKATSCWHALSFDGLTARLETALDESAAGAPKLLSMFDRDGTDGPLGITSDGQLYSTSTGTLRRVLHGLSGQLRVRAISRNGARFALDSDSPTDRVRLISTDDLSVQNRLFNPFWLQPEVRDFARPRNIRYRFTHIGVSTTGTLSLTSRKSELAIECAFSPYRVELSINREPEAVGRRQAFRRVASHPDVGYQLQVATWPDGSMAFLDSRGLLHLKSSDPGIPECSIVLTDGVLAGWCSDGKLWGARYFSGRDESGARREAFEDVITAFAVQLS